jgi:colanic acid/amylovoran biosynthesis glycosyltransferase
MREEKPTVAHFVSSYLFNTGSWIYSQLINLTRYYPVVLTSKLENQDQFPFESVYCYREPFTGSSKWQIGTRKFYEAVTHAKERFYQNVIKSQNVQLLHAHFGTQGFYNLGLQERVQLPLITTFYGDDMSKLPHSRPKWRKRYARLFEIGELFLAEGPYMAQAIVALGCPEYKIRVQHLGIDLQRISFIPRYRHDDEPVRVLMVSSFREKKGIPYGVEAFAQAVHKFPDMELRIIGGARTDAEKELMSRCQMIAKNEGIAHKVSFLGYIPYSEYLQEAESAHLFLAPSIVASDGDTEGGAPVSVTEASAAGLPVIATRHCDIPEVVIDGESGVLVAERDVPALAEAICQLASAPESWATLGKRGRAHIEAEFDINKQIQRQEAIYDSVLNC